MIPNPVARSFALALLMLTASSGCGDGVPVSCVADGDCSDLEDTPYCNPSTQLCSGPCTSDVPGTYACVDGQPVRCDSGMALGCTACPGSCEEGTLCDARTDSCVPPRPDGELCGGASECEGGICGANGRCVVEQGEPCTAASCDGICAGGATDGDSFCLRPCTNGSGCSTSSARGLTWVCLSSSGVDVAYCLPREDCDRGFNDYTNPCDTLERGRCGDALPADPAAPAVLFCAPPEIWEE